MSPSSVRSHILQPPYILLHLLPQFVLDLHRRELRGQLQNCAVLEGADFGPGMDVKSRHNALRHVWTNAIEGFEGALKMVRRAGGGDYSAEVNAPSRATARGS